MRLFKLTLSHHITSLCKDSITNSSPFNEPMWCARVSRCSATCGPFVTAPLKFTNFLHHPTAANFSSLTAATALQISRPSSPPPRHHSPFHVVVSLVIPKSRVVHNVTNVPLHSMNSQSSAPDENSMSLQNDALLCCGVKISQSTVAHRQASYYIYELS